MTKLICYYITFIVFLGGQSLAAAPTRPPKVPHNSVWAGGLDGGAWIRCDRISKKPWGPVFKCTTYNDQTGEVWSRGLYVVGYFENQTFHRVQRYDGQPRYTSFDGEVIHIRLRAAPTDGKANEALIEYIAGKLDVKKSDVAILHGHTGRNKIIGFKGMDRDRIFEKITEEIARQSRGEV